MPNTPTTDTPAVNRGGKRIYIVKDQENDQPVVRRVPVGVCAAPPRVQIQSRPDEANDAATLRIEAATADIARPRLSARVQRVRDAVRHPLHLRVGR